MKINFKKKNQSHHPILLMFFTLVLFISIQPFPSKKHATGFKSGFKITQSCKKKKKRFEDQNESFEKMYYYNP
jgi:hypothetical protein